MRRNHIEPGRAEPLFRQHHRDCCVVHAGAGQFDDPGFHLRPAGKRSERSDRDVDGQIRRFSAKPNDADFDAFRS